MTDVMEVVVMEQPDDSVGAAAELVQVMIVDDQAPFRDAARAVITRVPGFELAAEATTGEEAVEIVEHLRPSVVLMDINMGVMNGIEATRIITARYPDTFVVLVSTYTEDDLPAGARTCGAAAYVNKDELSPKVVGRLWETGGDPAWRANPAG